MDPLSNTTTETGHLAVTLITSIYNISLVVLFYPASLILSLIQYSLALFLLAFRLLTSPFATALHIAAFILSPVGYLFQFMLAPFFAITAIAIKLEPLYIFFSIAAILGTLTGLTIYLLTLPISALLTTTTTATTPPLKLLSNKPLPTPGYTTDEETYFHSSRRPSLDFDTDDANALLGTRRRQGPDLYAAWREKVGSARGGGGVSSTVTAVLSPPGGAGSGSGSKRRLPGLLFGTTIHEEEDDSL